MPGGFHGKRVSAVFWVGGVIDQVPDRWVSRKLDRTGRHTRQDPVKNLPNSPKFTVVIHQLAYIFSAYPDDNTPPINTCPPRLPGLPPNHRSTMLFTCQKGGGAKLSITAVLLPPPIRPPEEFRGML